MTRFNQGAAGAPAPRASGGNVFGGLDPNAGGSKFPMFPYDTTSTFEVVRTVRAQNTGDFAITEVRILESDSESVTPGATFAIVQAIGDKWGYGIARFSRMAKALGNLTDQEFDEMVLEARQGNGILNAALGDALGVEKYGENPFAGMKGRVYVTRGKDDGKGGHYREHTFTPVD